MNEMNDTQQAAKAFRTSRQLTRAAKVLAVAHTAALGCAAAALVFGGVKTAQNYFGKR